MEIEQTVLSKSKISVRQKNCKGSDPSEFIPLFVKK
jgi:hypothetical protein